MYQNERTGLRLKMLKESPKSRDLGSCLGHDMEGYKVNEYETIYWINRDIDINSINIRSYI